MILGRVTAVTRVKFGAAGICCYVLKGAPWEFAGVALNRVEPQVPPVA